MSLVKSTTYASDGVTIAKYTETSYEYDSAGNRVTSEFGEQTDGTTTITSRTRTEYLTDSRNHTGYSQVLQETEFNSNGVAIKKSVYTIGHDQILQTVFNRIDTGGAFGIDPSDGWDDGEVHDAHENLLNIAGGATPLTSYLYSGEAFDHNIGQQYLRAVFRRPNSSYAYRIMFSKSTEATSKAP